MNAPATYVSLNAPLQLTDPAGRPLPVQAVAIAYRLQGTAVSECLLKLAVTPEVHRRIDRDELFHLEQPCRGAGSGELRPDRPAQLELRLDAALLPSIHTAAGDHFATGVAPLGVAGPDSAKLFLTESWFALTVMQELPTPSGEGTYRLGYNTTWLETSISVQRFERLSGDDTR
ncbi:MAG: hypothetical protein ACRDG3_08655 [Tepidiformaceae bacterium]